MWRSGSQKHGSGRRGLGRGAFSRLVTERWEGTMVVVEGALVLVLLLLCAVLVGSSAHSTSVICSTSVGRPMGRLSMDAVFFQWSDSVYSASRI